MQLLRSTPAATLSSLTRLLQLVVVVPFCPATR